MQPGKVWVPELDKTPGVDFRAKYNVSTFSDAKTKAKMEYADNLAMAYTKFVRDNPENKRMA
jgi:hypothetical protein